MNSLKRLFSSILPSSWTEDPQNDEDNVNQIYENKDSPEEIQSRQKRKIKRRVKNSGQKVKQYFDFNEYDPDNSDISNDYGQTSPKKMFLDKSDKKAKKAFTQNDQYIENFDEQYLNSKCISGDNQQEFTNEEIRNIQR